MKKRTTNKLLALLSALVMVLGMLPMTVFADGDYTFDGGKLTIHTAAGVTTWGSDTAFMADNVTSLVIDSGVTTVGGTAFQTCGNMKSVTFKGAVTVNGASFVGCDALETVIFEDESTIGGGAFGECSSIQTVRFDGKTKISDGAFAVNPEKPNTTLTGLVFPIGSEIAASSIFQNYDALKSVTFKGDIVLGGGTFADCDALETVIFEGTSVVQAGAFSGCSGIKTLRFDGKTVLRNSAFSLSSDDSNNALKTLVFPADSEIDVASIFQYYDALKSVTFKGDIVLGGGTFSDCDALETVIFEGTSTVKDGAFGNCPALRNVSFKKAATLSGSAFSCESLDPNATTVPNTAMTTLVLPAQSSLKDGAFGYFSNLKTIVLGDGIELGHRILKGCTAVEEFIFEAATPPNFAVCAFSAFEPEDILIKVPTDAAKEAYKSALAEDNQSDPDLHHNIDFVDCVVVGSYTPQDTVRIPFTKNVEGEGAPAEEFSFRVADGNNQPFDDPDGPVVTDNTIKTNSVGSYSGFIIITGTQEQIDRMKQSVINIREDSKSGWHCDETEYVVIWHDHAWHMYNVTGIEVIKELADYGDPLEELEFTNTYVGEDDEPGDPGEEDTPTSPEKPIDPNVPETGNNSHLSLWIALMLAAGIGVVATTVLGKNRKGKNSK